MRLIVCSAICLCSAAVAFGQIDSSALRAKYGSPLHREIFTVRTGVEMTVTYAETGNTVCWLEIPAGVANIKEETAILNEILPFSIGEKDPYTMIQMMGLQGEASIDYGDFILSRPMTGGKIATRPAVAVTFKDSACRTPPPPHF